MKLGWWMNCLLLLGLTALSVATAVAQSSDAATSRPLVPNLVFNTLDGERWSLRDDNRGQIVVLNFWATWCGPCRSEVPYLIKLAEEFKDDVRVAGLSVDEASDNELVRKFVAEFKVSYPILRPEAGSPLANVSSLPMTLLIDRESRLAQKYTGAVPEKILREDIQKLIRETSAASTK